MGSLFSVLLLILLFSLAPSTSAKSGEDETIKSLSLLDQTIRNYTFQAFKNHYIKTGWLHAVTLPADFSGINVSTARFRCGSLRRYGARINEFYMGSGILVKPCAERVLIVRINIGKTLSSLFCKKYDLYGYELVSPVLGLLAYNADSDPDSKTQPEVQIYARESPILIDFSNATLMIKNASAGLIPLCASFGNDGKVKLFKMASSSHVCVAYRNGHYGLVIESPLLPLKKKKARRWKLAVTCAAVAALGAFLLGLLMVAMLVRGKRRVRLMDELERRAYEEEAMRVSMVDHVRALSRI